MNAMFESLTTDRHISSAVRSLKKRLICAAESTPRPMRTVEWDSSNVCGGTDDSDGVGAARLGSARVTPLTLALTPRCVAVQCSAVRCSGQGRTEWRVRTTSSFMSRLKWSFWPSDNRNFVMLFEYRVDD